MWYVGTHKCTAKEHGNKPFFIGLLSVLLVQKRHFQYEFNMILIWTVVSWLFWYRIEYTIKYKIVLKIIVKKIFFVIITIKNGMRLWWLLSINQYAFVSKKLT